ncbi:uncharacterized protein LOC129747914 [Uranotaenia lowii]|uniref:uncharacterized protein LOC129747914 n=1 Tax=Uranotaenia lowii TaxID=190385 RepID=UPI002479E16B|nr:uncharacterized protein LOC129747914 [Uranotaenia lowii]
MSARVCNPMILSEISKLRSPAIVRRPPTSKGISAARVKRDLFGPVDKEDSKKFIEREFAAQNEVLSKKWGFDFRAGQPLQNHEQYQWERVPPTSAPANYIDGMVTLTRAAHAVGSSYQSTASEDLMDQRAERENRLSFDSGAADRLRSPSVCSFGSSESEPELDACSSSSSSIQTYPVMPVSLTAALPVDKSNLPSCSSATSSSSFPASATRAKRQQRITDYLKERKRLAPNSSASKVALAKKARHMLNLSAPASSGSNTPSNAI